MVDYVGYMAIMILLIVVPWLVVGPAAFGLGYYLGRRAWLESTGREFPVVPAKSDVSPGETQQKSGSGSAKVDDAA